MDLKMFYTQTSFVSNLIGPMLSFSTYSCKTCSVKVSSFTCSYKGNAQNGVSFVGKDAYEVGDCSYRYDGSSTNPSLYTERRVLDAFDDEYGGVVVNPEKLPFEANVFASVLRLSVSVWRTEGKKGIWLKLPVEKCDLVPIAVREGFQYHHAETGYVMMTYWLPNEPCMLPANASHQVGVGGFVMNDKNEVLVVQEKHCAPELVGLWKLPTGFILESEEIFTGAIREVKEETGIDTEFLEVIAFRHAHNVAFEKSDLFFICMLKPVSSEIKTDDLEVQAAKVKR
ncbi:hypothetical protein M8C21_014910 [Ambrosia artemisiifolia]|uniref:Nudix hydrolase domain-containing protein n=1 Tax=Ambrosia artemisiifolia TaxID=4212 RepID=A0AAD5G1J1_AMBAR|nr:hypothetical protein M8C21_014910 [Ambrosia artemisiifolia]